MKADKNRKTTISTAVGAATDRQPTRSELIAEFYSAPDGAYFRRPVVAAVADCSEAKLERDSWMGAGIPSTKFGRNVLYKKSDVLAYLERGRQNYAAVEQRASVGTAA